MVEIPHILLLCDLRDNPLQYFLFPLFLLQISFLLSIFLLSQLPLPIGPVPSCSFLVDRLPFLLLGPQKLNLILPLNFKCSLHPIEFALENVELLAQVLELDGLVRY